MEAATVALSEIEQGLIQELVEAIKIRRLNLPVRLMLEMHRPLAGIGQFCFDFLRPFLGLVITAEKLEVLSVVLAKPEVLDYFIENLSED